MYTQTFKYVTRILKYLNISFLLLVPNCELFILLFIYL